MAGHTRHTSLESANAREEAVPSGHAAQNELVVWLLLDVAPGVA